MKHRSVRNTSCPLVPRILVDRRLMVLLDSFTVVPPVRLGFRTAMKASNR